MKKKNKTHTHTVAGSHITHKVQNTQQAFCCLQQASAHAQSHFTRAPYLQVCSLHPARVIQGSRRAFGQGGGENGPSHPCLLFFFIPGKQSVAEPDKPRTESVT